LIFGSAGELQSGDRGHDALTRGYCVSEVTFYSQQKRNAAGSRMRTATNRIYRLISYSVNVVATLIITSVRYGTPGQ